MNTSTMYHLPSAAAVSASPSKRKIWAGRLTSGLAVTFLLMDGVMKLVKPAPVIEGTLQLGFPEHIIRPLGVLLLTCVTLYVLPRTSVLGAILLTGYLGGAVATHVRVDNPLFSHVLFPVYLAVMIWAGLALRYPKLGEVLRSRNG
jgi:ABC-type transport system involved in cytochrome c biogenesis permease component